MPLLSMKSNNKLLLFYIFFHITAFGHDLQPLGYFVDKDGTFERKMEVYFCENCKSVCVDRLMLRNINSLTSSFEIAPFFSIFTDHGPLVLGLRQDTANNNYNAFVMYPHSDYLNNFRWEITFLSILNSTATPPIFRAKQITENLFRLESSVDDKTWSGINIEYRNEEWITQTQIDKSNISGTELQFSPLLNPEGRRYDLHELSEKIWPNTTTPLTNLR